MAEAQQQPQAQFAIEKIYVKDVSLESPNAPQIFLEREQPQLEFSFANKAQAIGNDFHEVALTATVTAKVGEKTLFLVEATQAGIFLIKGVPASDMEPIYSITCPTILQPYLRESISDLTVRAGFPPVFLAPMNFDALYRQQQQQAGQPAETSH